MKFVFFGYDYMLSVAHRLIEDGHELMGIFSFECDNIFNFNLQCQALAAEKNIPFILTPPEAQNIDDFITKGAQIFLASGYPFKIPPIDENKAIGINMHPSYLPRARGLMPVPHILLNHDEAAAGLTIHKLAPTFDQGDILMQRQITLQPDETVETYCAKTLIDAPDMASQTFANLATLWENAAPQNEEDATNAPAPTDDIRTLTWDKPVSELLKIGRAFGRFGCIAYIGDDLYSVMEFQGWEEQHDHPPGTCGVLHPKIAVITAADGYICLKDFQKMPSSATPER